MILIADSGSSKTDWICFDRDIKKIHFESKGLNPIFQSVEEIYFEVHRSLMDLNPLEISKVYFFGAGSISGETDHIIKEAMHNQFSKAKIDVADDMIGAAKSLFGNDRGIACILGTGSNSCLYNGSAIEEKIPALGYILGDEGSGAYIGKQFLNQYLKYDLPKDFYEIVQKELKLSISEVINSVYKQENPNRYLAGYSNFLAKHLEHPYVYQLIKSCIEDFISKNVLKYRDCHKVPVSFVGSIAWFYQDIVRTVASEKTLQVGKIIQKPVEGLYNYYKNIHLNENN